MMKDKIIKLDNGINYCVIEEIDYNGKKYILSSKCDLEKDEIDEENFVVQEVYFDNDATLITRNIEDNKLALAVGSLLIDKIQNS